MRALLLTSLLATAAAAQTVVDVPSLPTFQNIDRPFAGGVGRYQQWYKASTLAAAITEPMRFEQIEFLAGSQNSQAPASMVVNCEIKIGHGKSFGVFGTFDGNWDEPPVTVMPLGSLTITNAPSGQPCVTVPFSQFFTWDTVRPVLVEIRIYGNNQQNLPFLFNNAGTTQALGVTNRVYSSGNAGATSGIVQQGVGMITRFQARPGAMLEFGSGCPGEGGFVPQNSTDQVASLAGAWTQNLTNAASQKMAVWVIGDTNSSPFPVDLTMLFGLPPSGCMLLTNPVNVIPVTTVGGGPGGGVASLPIQLPATGGYDGLYLYTQWVVFNPAAPNGALSVTPGLWTIVAPFGG